MRCAEEKARYFKGVDEQRMRQAEYDAAHFRAKAEQEMRCAEEKARYFKGVDEQRMRQAEHDAAYFRAKEAQRMRDAEDKSRFCIKKIIELSDRL